MKSVWFIFSLLSLLVGCSGLEQSEYEKTRRQNAHGEFVYRNHDEVLFPLQPIQHRVRPPYPWEKTTISGHTRITKEYFRCKGSSMHPPRQERDFVLQDCGGSQKHGLPLRNGKEFVYPILMELLNYLQEKTGKKVIITCGYRCPDHNRYADASSSNQASKHMLGAEVDFYVQGLEYQPEKVVKLLIDYYQGKKESAFTRYDKGDLNVSTPPWMNSEIFIKLYQKHEGRDFDNRHPYPYLSIQVRFDRDLAKKVVYSHAEANGCYKRY